MTDSRAHAVALARRNFRVFRVEIVENKPAYGGWIERASADPDKVFRDFTDILTGESVTDNPGILTGDDLLVVDSDHKNGTRNGKLSHMELVGEGLPSNTLTVRTSSGGTHSYFRVPVDREFRNRVGWREHVDIRCHHGFVTAPGAIRDGVTYEIVNDAPIADLPEQFVEELSRPRGLREPLTDFETKFEDDWSIASAIAVLAAVPADEGQRHSALIAAMHKCFDLGVTPDTLEGLIEQHVEWFGDLYTQDLSAELDSVTKGRIRDGKQWGVEHPRAQPSAYAVFEKVALGNAEDEKPKGAGVEYRSVLALECYDMEGSDADNPLVPELLDLNSVVAFYGPSNVGKSFSGASLAYAVATGGRWGGRETVKGLAVYIAYEGARRFRRRIAALVEHHKPQGSVPLALMPPPKGSIHDAGWHKAVLAEVRRLEHKTGEIARLIIVDTLAAARVGAGKEENDNDAMNEVAAVLRKLADATGACVMVIHHTGKDKEKGMRGASALEGAVDTAIMLDDGVLKVTKQREYDRGPDMGVETIQVVMPVEKGGAKSLVALVGGARVTIEPDDEPLFLTLLDKIGARGVRLTLSKFGSYAPKLMADEPEAVAVGADIKRLERAMNALKDAGSIVVKMVTDSNYRKKEWLVRNPQP